MPELVHLLVDARPVEHPTARQRGIGRYVTGLIAGLGELNAPFTALVDTDLQASTLAEAVPGVPLARWSPQVVRHQAQPGTWYLATQLMLHPVPADPIPAVITQARLPVAAVMYDVIPHRYPERYLVDPFARRLAEVRAPMARTLDALLAISRFAAETAADELDYPLDRIAVIGAGVEDRFAPPAPPAARPGYLIAVTGGDPRKNTEGLLRAWAMVPPAIRQPRQLKIVAAHSPAVARQWHTAAVTAGLTVGPGEDADVTFTGAVTDEQMVALLQGAELAVMPSLEEGFGLPVLEAAACGVPAICSRVSSLPEVLDLDDATFDPHDTGSITAAIIRALTDAEHRLRLLDAGRAAVQRWQWSNVAQATLDALSALGPRWPRPLRPPAERLAVLAPGADSPSGIGPYTSQVIASLGTEVDHFVDTSGDPHGAAPNLSVRTLGRSAAASRYDHLVAVLGSSHHHIATAQATADLMTAGWSVHLWLHEASLVGVHLGLAHASGVENWARTWIEQRLVASEPPSRRAAVTDPLDPHELRRHGVTLLAELASRAASVIVSTDAAAAAVRRALSDVGLTPPPVAVIPLAFPPTTGSGTPPAGHDVVSLGWLAPNKAPEVVIEAFARIDPLPPDARLVFAGPVQGDIVDTLRRRAQDLGVDDRLVISGHLDPDAYRATIAGARVGVQWRRDHQGEQSAAVNDLVAAGVPTITNLPALGTLDSLEELAPLLHDDDHWRAASQTALAAANAWTFTHVAEAVLTWVRAPAR